MWILNLMRMNSKKLVLILVGWIAKKKIPYSLEIHIEVEGEMMLHMNSSQKKIFLRKKKTLEETRQNQILFF